MILSDLGLSIKGSYNGLQNMSEGRAFLPVVPRQAVSVAYSRYDLRGGAVYAIARNTKHLSKCMQLLSWLYSPEGEMTVMYGPKGVCWDYDSDGFAYLTDFGKKCQEEAPKPVPMQGEGGYEGDFTEGQFQFTATGFHFLADNPDGNGELFSDRYWKNKEEKKALYTSQQYDIGYIEGQKFDQDALEEMGYETGKAPLTGKIYAIEKDWCKDHHAPNIQSYLENREYRLVENTDGKAVLTVEQWNKRWEMSEKEKRKILKKHQMLHKTWMQKIFGRD